MKAEILKILKKEKKPIKSNILIAFIAIIFLFLIKKKRAVSIYRLSLVYSVINGAGYEIRTHNLRLTMALLYRWS